MNRQGGPGGGDAAAEIESSESQWVFSILPKAFQKKPLVDQTVITEMTEEGKKLAPPSRENPAYNVAQAGGFHAEGQGPVDSKLPPAAELEDCLQRALATNHCLPASPGHPPSPMILYHWGVHTNLDRGSAEVEGEASPDMGLRNLLGRAALDKQDLQDETTFAPPGSMLSNLGPLRLFIDRDMRTQQLYEESLADCYFVVASAYDYQAATVCYFPARYCAMTWSVVGLPLAQPRTSTSGLAMLAMYLFTRATSSGSLKLKPISDFISCGMPARARESPRARARCASLLGQLGGDMMTTFWFLASSRLRRKIPRRSTCRPSRRRPRPNSGGPCR